jgi:hypothetical protein
LGLPHLLQFAWQVFKSIPVGLFLKHVLFLHSAICKAPGTVPGADATFTGGRFHKVDVNCGGGGI